MRSLAAGQSLARIRMNQALTEYTLRGRVVDVGGGHAPDYFDFFKKSDSHTVEVLDGSMTGIDFEKDALPYAEGTADTVILCNVLEHIYDHQFILREVHRILAVEGTLIGFVPFWVGYHPDPHDYFRYTPEALTRMLSDAGLPDHTIRPIATGPLLANFNTIVLSLPRMLRPLAYIWYAAFDTVFLKARPNSAQRNPLGYLFVAQNHA